MSFGLNLAPGRYIPSKDNPILFRYSAGDNISTLGGTFTRASSATYLNSSGLLATATSNVPRDSHYIGSNRHLLLEGARTKLAVADIDTWFNQGETSVGNTTDIGPTGETEPMATPNIAGSDGSDQGLYTTVTIPTSGVYTFSVWVCGGFGSSVYLYFSENHQRIKIDFLGTSVWQRVTITSTLAAGDVYPVFDTHDRLDNVDNLSSVGFKALRPQVEAGAFASSTIYSSFGDSASRAADSLSFPFPYPPQEMSVYVRGIFQGDSSATYVHLIDIGSPPDRLTLWTAIGQNINTDFVSLLDSGTSSLTADATFEAAVRVGSDGGLSSMQRINGGADESSAGVSGIGFPANWSTETLRVNGSNYLERTGFVAFRDIIIASGVRDLAYFRALLL